jgi:hypothetical protein
MILRSLLAVTAVMCFVFSAQLSAAEKLNPGETTSIYFDNEDFPPTLYAMFTGQSSTATLQVRLPDDYTPEKTFPLLLYVPGFHGHAGGNIQNAIDLAGTEGCIAASLPLFKSRIDVTEPGNGVIVSFDDYARLSECYRTMLSKLFELVPNIDSEKSAMVGYSNGAIATSILVTLHDEFILQHFRSFCFVDQGMFHLTDLHKSTSRDCRFLVLAGGKDDFGRDLKVRQCKLLYDSWQMLKVDLQYGIMKNVGHEFEPFVELIGTWIRDRDLKISADIELGDETANAKH